MENLAIRFNIIIASLSRHILSRAEFGELTLIMRHKGSGNNYKQQQDAEIILAFRKIMHLYGGEIGTERIYELVASAPAPRFFVAPVRAAIVISDMRKGKVLNMQHAKKRMYDDLYCIVARLAEQYPEKSLRELCDMAVMHPAPEFYKSIRQIKQIISERQHQCYATRKQRLRFCCM